MDEETIIKTYGYHTWQAMKTSTYLDGITCRMTKDGKMDIPERDLENAYKDIQGLKVHWWEWD